MKNWNRLFIRHGFMVNEENANVFSCKKETEENRSFLLESLNKLSITYEYAFGMLTILSPVVSEEKWLDCVDFQNRGGGEGPWFRPGQEEPKVRELDTYIAGLVRQMNRLGLHTIYCCDGHGRQSPSISFAEWVDMEKISTVLQAVGVPSFRISEQRVTFGIPRKQLLDTAEMLAIIAKKWLSAGFDLNKQLFLRQLEQCLSINGESGNEEKIRNLVIDELRPNADFVSVDRTGNILAQKQYGTGHGPTILVNAHLDTVDIFESGREVVKEDSIWSSSKGILGADDRAGIAVILELARRLPSIQFNGTVKFIFTVEEEIGLVGARKIDDYFLWGVDAAFVVDRRGKGDIVTSCGGYEPFCAEGFGLFIEEIAKVKGLEGWKCTKGGSSDTRIWTSHGIQSVNLSVGYQNEHTSGETLDVEACYQTYELLCGIFENSRELKRTIHHIRNGSRMNLTRTMRISY